MDIYAPLAERIGMQRFKDRSGGPLVRRDQSTTLGSSIEARLEYLKSADEDLPGKIEAELKGCPRAKGPQGLGFRPGQIALLDLAQDAA